MSSEARAEAIDIVAEYLNGATRDGPGALPPKAAHEIVDKLLETHAIVRRTIRTHRPAAPRPAGESAIDELRRTGARA